MIYLYVKQHSVTGLKYFGKTTCKNPFSYPGSGLKWKSHIKKHGKQHIKTLDVFGFDNQQLCTEFALKFSKDNNIVEENMWANLKDENGLDGCPRGYKQSDEHRMKMSISSKNRISQKHSEETKLKMIEAHKNRTYSPCKEETKKKISETKRLAPKKQCENCKSFVSSHIYTRFHGTNCSK